MKSVYPYPPKKAIPHKADVTRDDLQRRFLAIRVVNI